MPQVDYRRGEATAGYTFWGKRGKWYRQLLLEAGYNYTETQDGELISSAADLMVYYKGPLQSYLQFKATQKKEAFLGNEFDQLQFSFYSNLKPIRGFEFTLIGNFGDRIDYKNNRLGRRVQLYPQVVWKPSRHMLLEMAHIFERMEVNGVRLFTANVSYLKAAYHFNVRAFVRAIVQYADYDYNVDNYTFQIAPERKLLTSQLLFVYRINPRTVLFLGYSDNYLGNQAFALTQSDRTYFAKISYAWSL